MLPEERKHALLQLFEKYLTTTDEHTSLDNQPYYEQGTTTLHQPDQPFSTTHLYDVKIREALQLIVTQDIFWERLPPHHPPFFGLGKSVFIFMFSINLLAESETFLKFQKCKGEVNGVVYTLDFFSHPALIGPEEMKLTLSQALPLVQTLEKPFPDHLVDQISWRAPNSYSA